MKYQKYYESPKIDKDGLSEKAIDGQIKSEIKYIPHECLYCRQPSSVTPTGTSFCRNEDCILKGWRF